MNNVWTGFGAEVAFANVDGVEATAEDVARASGVAMERYGLSESAAVALLSRLAIRQGVTVGVVAAEDEG